MNEYNEVSYGSRGVHIVVLDTGCTLEHPFFSGVDCQCFFVERFYDSIDRCGHGTFTISVIVKNMQKYSGVPYHLTSIKVSETSSVNLQDLKDGLSICSQIDADVIYIGSCNFTFDNIIAQKLELLAQNKTLIIVPAGNYPFHEATYPSCLDTTICCGLSNEDGDICYQTNTYAVDVFVSGEHAVGVLSAENAKRFQVEWNPDGFSKLQTTSFSAAAFAAIAAILKTHQKSLNVYSLLKLRTSKIAVHLENSIVNSTKVIESSSL